MLARSLALAPWDLGSMSLATLELVRFVVSWPKDMADLDDILGQRPIAVDDACATTRAATTAADGSAGLACGCLGFGADMPAWGLVGAGVIQARNRPVGATCDGPRLFVRW